MNLIEDRENTNEGLLGYFEEDNRKFMLIFNAVPVKNFYTIHKPSAFSYCTRRSKFHLDLNTPESLASLTLLPVLPLCTSNDITLTCAVPDCNAFLRLCSEVPYRSSRSSGRGGSRIWYAPRMYGRGVCDTHPWYALYCVYLQQYLNLNTKQQCADVQTRACTR